MDGEEEVQKPNMLRSVSNAFGGGMTKERRNDIYFGREPPGLHPKHKSLEHIHEIGLSSQQISSLYGLPPKAEMVIESSTSDTKQDLVSELQAKGLTREEARETITDLIKAGILVEQYDPDSEKRVLVLRQ